LARTPTTPKLDSSKPVSNGVLHPQSSDPKLELFYMLGVLRGANVEGSIRIAELVNQILTPAAEPETGAGE
jgi:hypothetical protein